MQKQLEKRFQIPFQQQSDMLTLRRESHDASYVCNSDGALIGLNIRNQASLQRVVIPSEWSALEYLNISDNENLKTLKFETPLPKLFHLDLSDSKITSIKFETGFTALKWLDASRNDLQQLQLQGDMPELKYLDLSGNNLQEFLIPTIFQKLEYLYLEGNNLSNIQKEIYEGKKNCWEDVKNYFRASLTSGVVLNTEAKFIFFGNGRVGKTTLSHQLRTGEFDDSIKYTHGILIKEWTIAYEDFPDTFKEKLTSEIKKHSHETGAYLEMPKEILLNVWDFGGQEYFHATHRLFLNSNVMYLVVWDEKTNAQNETIGNYPYSYWKKNIDHYAAKNITLFVQNKEMDNANFNHQDLKYKVANREKINDASIQKYDLDIKELEKGILSQLPKLEYLGIPIAKIYDDIRNELKKRKEIKPFVTFSEFRNLCQSVDKTEEQIMQNESDIESVTKFLHETGSLICYRFKENKTSKALNDYVFIDPKWVTETIYQILDKKTEKQDGEFDKKHIIDTLKAHKNIVSNSNLWIELMCEFELIFEKKDTKNTYIAPQFLKKECKDLSEKALNNFYAELPNQLILHYPDFLPRSIISRFICKYGNLAQDYYWKYGIVVHKDGEKAMVKCDYDEKQIIIYSQHHSSALAVELFYVLRNLDNAEKLEVLISDTKDTKKLIGPVNIRKLEEQVLKERKYIDWKNKEYEISHFIQVFGRNELAHGVFGKKIISTLKTNTEKQNDMDDIRKLMGQGRISQAFKALENKGDKDAKTVLTLLQGRWSGLKNKEMMGIISSADANLERNQIIMALLNLIAQIEAGIADNTTKQSSSSNRNSDSNQNKGQEDDSNTRSGRVPKEYKKEKSNIIEVKQEENTGSFIDFNEIKEKIKILFLAATPMRGSQLNTGKESRFKDLIRYFDDENRFEFKEQHGMTTEDFQNFLVYEDPHIVHYGGHGEEEGIVLEDEELDGEILAEILENSENTQCVVLNACYSVTTAKAVAKHIPYVIGTQGAIPDDTAIAFARGFYMGIVAGKSIEKAFKNGITTIKRKRLTGANIPILVKGIK